MNGKSLLVFGRNSKGNEKHAIGNGRKGGPCHMEAENLPELCPLFVGKTELVSDHLGYRHTSDILQVQFQTTTIKQMV